MKHAALVGVLLIAMGSAADSQQAQQGGSTIPDAPTPQAADPNSLGTLKNEVKPGAGTTALPPPDAAGTHGSGANGTARPSSSSASAGQGAVTDGSSQNQEESIDIPPPGQGVKGTLVVTVNEVIVPVSVRDKKGALVPALDARQFRVFEDGVRQRIRYFTSDPFPLSVAFVIDQSLPSDTMNKVNQSLSAVTGAFTPADSVAVFGYNSTPQEITDFTGAQGARLHVALDHAKAPGRDLGVIAPGGPLDNGVTINGKVIDPNTQRGGSAGSITTPLTPKEFHPLHDAILAAATQLAKQPQGRRRVLYIISDGKEQGSRASYKEVVRFLLGNNISVYGTLVGDSATWGLGYLDKFHLPLIPTVRDNVLPKYAIATGGTLDSAFSENSIQMSFAKITDAARNQYTIIYNSHANVLASSLFHTIEVRVEGIPNLNVIAPDGYYPSAHSNGH